MSASEVLNQDRDPVFQVFNDKYCDKSQHNANKYLCLHHHIIIRWQQSSLPVAFTPPPNLEIKLPGAISVVISHFVDLEEMQNKQTNQPSQNMAKISTLLSNFANIFF